MGPNRYVVTDTMTRRAERITRTVEDIGGNPVPEREVTTTDTVKVLREVGFGPLNDGLTVVHGTGVGRAFAPDTVTGRWTKGEAPTSAVVSGRAILASGGLSEDGRFQQAFALPGNTEGLLPDAPGWVSALFADVLGDAR